MRIISKFKDYYDGIQGIDGIDNTLVYCRTYTKIPNSELPNEFKHARFSLINDNIIGRINTFSLKRNNIYSDCASFIVGFCGKLYVGWKLYDKDNNVTITFDNKYVETIVESMYRNKLSVVINNISNYNCFNIFKKYQAPIFILDNRNVINSELIINPILKEYQFYKKFDSFSAFQEIEMFLGEKLGSTEKIIDINDKYKLTQYGFDKYSFRKEKQLSNGRNKK
jgi:hypothetical protein